MAKPPKANPLVRALLDSLEEMRLFPDEESRKRAVEEHIKAASSASSLAIGVVLLVGAVAAAHVLLKYLLPFILPTSLPPITGDLLHLAGIVAVFFVTLRALHRWGAGADMRRRLLRAGVPVCLKCGYLLRGLDPGASRCPECGRVLGDATRSLLRQPAPAGDGWEPSGPSEPRAS